MTPEASALISAATLVVHVVLFVWRVRVTHRARAEQQSFHAARLAEIAQVREELASIQTESASIRRFANLPPRLELLKKDDR
jgi:hypothetical protein